MQPAFLSLTEAARQTGKNTDTIRRLIKKLLAADPNTPDILQLPIKNGARMYYISMAGHIQKSLHPVLEEAARWRGIAGFAYDQARRLQK